MRREHTRIHSPAIGASGDLIAYGHYGQPVLVFPSEQGHARDYENNGMVDALGHLIEAGRLKLYCVDSYDASSWQADLPLEERARRHGRYEQWITGQIAPAIHFDCGGPLDIFVTGCSFGAFHAANFALKRADLFPVAICLSGVFDVSRVGWGERGDAVYFNNPMDYVSNFEGDHLRWLQGRVRLLLVCGQGQWEDSTGSLASTRDFAGLLAKKGIKHELDLWGHDVPHDWPSWRAQIAHHMQRLC